MKNSVRLSLLAALVLTALAFSAYGVALAAPGLNLGSLLSNLSVDQIATTATDVTTATPVVTETPEVVETETPEATASPEVENDVEDGEVDNVDDGEVDNVDNGEVVCAAAPAGTTPVSSVGCDEGSHAGSHGDDGGSGGTGSDDGGGDH